ncbi:two-component system, NarL family, sensor histidine kinase LiaS [Mariprofundus micogutta]|uniref:histidine kinase n=1 Tax=Mariprofundus micogutta TaxID=1921010 RepID=A0A1L8CNQ7_9PROT|nr:ATP-binding protein [Mariprofundus micogutta]GAV20551.1 two-component system, NarL family, sensor histidine kinase LiaS [Mariprofundus micogutta]
MDVPNHNSVALNASVPLALKRAIGISCTSQRIVKPDSYPSWHALCVQQQMHEITDILDKKSNRGVWRRFLMLALPVAGILVLSSYLFLQSEKQLHLDTVRIETAHHIESQAKNIRVEVKQAVLHVKFLSKHSEVVEVLKNDDIHAFDELSHDFHSFAKYMGVYDQVRLLDRNGYEVVRANFKDGEATLTQEEHLQDKSNHDYFNQTINLPDQNVFISDLTLNVEHGRIEQPYKPVIRYAAPVIDSDGEKIGVVVINFLGKVLIDRYLDATDVAGENMLLNANSFFIHAEDENVTWGSMLDSREDHSFANSFPDIWNGIVEARDGQILSEDGLFTFATVSPYGLISQDQPQGSGADDWVIVSHVPSAELFADSENSFQMFVKVNLLMLILWMIVAWLWARAESGRAAAFLKLQQVFQTKRSLLRQQLNLQELERRSLARALHDDMGQSLTSIQAYAAAIGKSLTEKSSETVGVNVQRIRDITTHIQKSVRSQLHDLRPASLDRLGLSAAVQDMLEEFSQRESITCEFVCESALPRLSDGQNIHLYRIVQEALTNIAKYAQAQHVKVCMNPSEGRLNLLVSDDGCGMATIEESGLGLLGMRERTELLNGEINITSALKKGVSISVKVPLEMKI